MPTLIPAYGRDYKSAKAIIQDYEDGKDFILRDITSPWDGKYCSIRDFQQQQVVLRYHKMTRLAIHQPTNLYRIFELVPGDHGDKIEIDTQVSYGIMYDAVQWICSQFDPSTYKIIDRWGTHYHWDPLSDTFESV